MNKFKFFIKDFGCKINQYDARLIGKNLSAMGKIASSEENADIILINSCSVTHRAAREAIKYYRKIKRKHPKKEILAVGCTVKDEKEKFGTEEMKVLPQFKYLNHPSGSIEEFYGHTRAFVKIQQGCKGICSYCIIKKIKKPYFIKTPFQAVREIRKLSKKHPELVLCATNFKEYPEILNLIHAVKKIDSIYRWRFSSLHPECFSQELLRALNRDNRFCRHFHIPIQSANNEVLKKMRRGYTHEQVISALQNAKRILDGVVFSFDVIVGFPGETDKQFRDTVDFIENFAPIKVHVFRYSDRPGTDACGYEDKIDEIEKKDRMKKIEKISRDIKMIYFKSTVNKIKEIIVEDNNGGYTRDYFPVKIRNCSLNKTKTPGAVNIKVVGFTKNNLIGNIV